MYKDSRYTSLRHKAGFTYDSLNRLTRSIAALGRTHARGRHVCATRGSLLSLFDDTWGTVKEWPTAAAVKGGCLIIAEKASNSLHDAGELSEVSTVVKPAVGRVAIAGVFLATAVDMAQRSGCSAAANPELYQCTYRAVF
jgi:hypothetical protein